MPIDRPHAPSVYAANAEASPARPALAADVTADVCVVGAGYTGLSAALHLAARGRSVRIVEAHRVGWGASGRNGGQVHNGQRLDQPTLEKWFGEPRARELLDLADAAVATVKDLIAEHAIACDWRDGLIHALHKRRFVEPTRRELDAFERRYGARDLDFLEAPALAAAIGTDVYHGGWRDGRAGHLNPLAYAEGLARVAEAAGTVIHEGTRAVGVAAIPGGGWRVTTGAGSITCGDVVIAADGHLDGLDPEIAAHVLPIQTFMLATEPLGDRAATLIPGGEGVADSRFVVHYWRLDAEGRLIFGGGERYGRSPPRDVVAFVRGHMLKIYPQLADVGIDHAWGGTVAVTMNRLPFVRRLQPGYYTAAGYSGHGIAIATFAGRLIAEAIDGDTTRFDVMASLPARKFPGGPHLRWPTLVLAMTWYGLRDRL
ncbi:FAD-binding oxidoreductase [Siculibacillus lacustris]|uniref:FAD-binding oxidoreductase n=1 Tax=Siculibacillus lacustris TaxID=1549641 RepID=A0A4Q9VKX3_9HYPH|nr:FAD-binding oxidoreductase [Siculibacillus lacustris]TBW35981.1 FAD-binding oxidoreductase [Siculibacillus lacustris]